MWFGEKILIFIFEMQDGYLLWDLTCFFCSFCFCLQFWCGAKLHRLRVLTEPQRFIWDKRERPHYPWHVTCVSCLSQGKKWKRTVPRMSLTLKIVRDIQKWQNLGPQVACVAGDLRFFLYPKVKQSRESNIVWNSGADLGLSRSWLRRERCSL